MSRYVILEQDISSYFRWDRVKSVHVR